MFHVQHHAHMETIMSTQRPLPRIPRETWTTHPRYPGQTLLLRSHASFRDVSRWLADESARASPQHARLRGVFLSLIRAMRGHEHYEEHKLYPYLESVYDVDLKALRDEHAELHEHEARVRSALESTSPALHALTEAYAIALDEHLQDEESLVIPMLLELTPDAFQRYYNTPAWKLLSP